MNNKLQTILLKAKEDVYSHLSGGNLSRILGQGYDFSELREYDPSDDIRHISWINSAKLGKPYVRKMHEEKELNVAVATLLDGRFVLDTKRELLEYVVAVLAYSAYGSNDLFSSLMFVGSKLKYFESTKNLYAIEQSLEAISEVELLGTKMDYEKVSSIKFDRKQLLFLVGDFLDSVDLSLLTQKHEVVVIVIRDELEEHPLASPNTQLINPQSNQHVSQTLSKKAIAHYKSKLLEHDEVLFQHFHHTSVKYMKISSEDEFLWKLERLFF